jgi:hypothetical protein
MTSRTSAPNRLRRSRLFPIGFARWAESRRIDEGISSAPRTRTSPPYRGGGSLGARPANASVLAVLPGRQRSFGIAARCLARDGAVGSERRSFGSGGHRPTRRTRLRVSARRQEGNLEGERSPGRRGRPRLATIGQALRTRRRSKASKPTLRFNETSKADSGNGGGGRCRAGSGGTARGQRPR